MTLLTVELVQQWGIFWWLCTFHHNLFVPSESNFVSSLDLEAQRVLLSICVGISAWTVKWNRINCLTSQICCVFNYAGTILWMRLVSVQATAVERNGRDSKMRCNSRTPSPYESQSPLPLSHELLGLTSPCPPTIILMMGLLYLMTF